MAARVGTGVTGSGSGAAASIASASKSTTTGNLLVAFVKWETTGRTCSGLTDTAGNTWTIIAEVNHGAGEPDTCLAYAANITANAANVVTATFSGGNANFRQIMVEEFSGLATSSVTDGVYQSRTGGVSDYTTPNITTTTSGLVFMGIGEYATLSGLSGTPGTPDFTVGISVSDAFIVYLLSGSAQTVSPGASATGGVTQWAAISQAFKDAGAVVPIPPRSLYMTQAVNMAGTF